MSDRVSVGESKDGLSSADGAAIHGLSRAASLRSLMLCCAALVTLLWPRPASAHLGSTKYLRVDVQREGDVVRVRVRAELETVDVGMQLGLGEEAAAATVLARGEEVGAWLSQGIQVSLQQGTQTSPPQSAPEACPVRAEAPVEASRDGRSFIATTLRYVCTGEGSLSLLDETVFPEDRQHEALVYLEGAAAQGGEGATVLRQGRQRLDLDSGARSLGELVRAFLVEGGLHFAGGYDHVLFLLSLLLGAGVSARNEERQARALLRDLAWLVTAFTLGHSVTLALAALQIVVLPSAPVEIAIALSIVLVALHTLVRPDARKSLPLVAGAFGLIHGFGFSSVLLELGLPAAHAVAALVSFNVGIELAQLAFVALMLGPLLVASRRPWYGPWVVRGGSILIALVAMYWVVERF